MTALWFYVDQSDRIEVAFEMNPSIYTIPAIYNDIVRSKQEAALVALNNKAGVVAQMRDWSESTLILNPWIITSIDGIDRYTRSGTVFQRIVCENVSRLHVGGELAFDVVKDNTSFLLRPVMSTNGDRGRGTLLSGTLFVMLAKEKE